MRSRWPKRFLFQLAGLSIILGLLAVVYHGLGPRVTILDPRFRFLSVQISRSTRHKLYLNGPKAGPLMAALHHVGLPINDAPLVVATTNYSLALITRFTGDFPPNELAGMQAEIMDDAGRTTHLPRPAGYNLEGSPHVYGAIWVLNSEFTNSVIVRLRPRIGEPPLAEIRIGLR